MVEAICSIERSRARSARMQGFQSMPPKLQYSVGTRQQHSVTAVCDHPGMDTVGGRIRQQREAKGISRIELSKSTGVGYSTLAELERGGMQSSTKLRQIAEALGVSQKWLETGRGGIEAPSAPPDLAHDWSDVRGYAQAVGLGAGAEAQEYAETHSLKFRASSLSRKGLPAAQLAVMYGDGDSMQPRIHPGDAILFDTGDTKARDGTLYVIQVHGAANAEYQVKRAMVLDDAVYFTADNPAGDHYWQKPRRADAKRGHIEIIGRVRWIGSWED